MKTALVVIVLLTVGAAHAEDDAKALVPQSMGELRLLEGTTKLKPPNQATKWAEVRSTFVASAALQTKAKGQDGFALVPSVRRNPEAEVEFWAFRGAPDQCTDEPLKGDRGIKVGTHKAVLSRAKENGGPLAVFWISGAWCLQLTAKGGAIARTLGDKGIIAAATDASAWVDHHLPVAPKSE